VAFYSWLLKHKSADQITELFDHWLCNWHYKTELPAWDSEVYVYSNRHRLCIYVSCTD